MGCNRRTDRLESDLLKVQFFYRMYGPLIKHKLNNDRKQTVTEVVSRPSWLFNVVSIKLT